MQMLDLIHQRRHEGKDTLMLCVGQPSTGAPGSALDAVEEVLRSKPLGYTEIAGDADLRETIARWHREKYGTDTRAENVVVTTGSSGGFVAAFLVFLEHGDTVALACPGYPAYRNILQSLGAKVVDLHCGPATRFQPTAAMLEALPEEDKPRMLIVTSPGNPTGTIIDPEELERIARWCEANDCVLLSDEDYHGISFGRPTQTARAFSDDAVVVGTLSKYFSMTGWRLGWLIMPECWVPRFTDLLGSLALCPPAVSQVGALGAFQPEAIAELDAHVTRYAAAREILLEEFPAMGLDTFADPDGGLYLWVNVEKLTQDSEAWCRMLVDDIGVAFAPGVDFDPYEGRKWVRVSLCASAEDTREACRRLRAYLARFERRPPEEFESCDNWMRG